MESERWAERVVVAECPFRNDNRTRGESRGGGEAVVAVVWVGEQAREQAATAIQRRGRRGQCRSSRVCRGVEERDEEGRVKRN